MSRVIIAGSRWHTPTPEEVTRAVTEHEITHETIITTVLSGGANGVDRAGERYAQQHGIPVEKRRPEWAKYGLAAGPIRNRAMARRASGLILIWDGWSVGSQSMLTEARARDLHITEVRINGTPP